MTLWQSILLGIVQGITEFLPVSSSGHLVIVPYLLNWQIPAEEAFAFDVLVQVATLIGVFVYFSKDLASILRSVFTGLIQRQPFKTPEARLGWYVILATVPAGLVGLALRDVVELAFNSEIATALFLVITAGLLFTAERSGRRNRCLQSMTWKDAVWIGVFQAMAIFPGISRSGSTITGGMTRDLERSAAARFSFLMSIPIMLAAGLTASLDLLKIPNLGSILPTFIPGFITAAVVGYLAMRWLLAYLSHHPLTIFAAYCIAISLFVLGTTIIP